MEKSPFDKKEYRYVAQKVTFYSYPFNRAITLDNGIRALLITDNKTCSRSSKRKRAQSRHSDAEAEEDDEDEDEDEADSDEESEGGEGVDGAETERRSADEGKSLRVRVNH